MSNARNNASRRQNTDISRIVGILLLEAIAAILLLNLAGYAREQRSELTPQVPRNNDLLTQVRNQDRPRYPYPDAAEFGESLGDAAEKSLPKLAAGRYNGHR